MSAQYNLQDTFLNTVRQEHISLTIFLMNGFQLKGTVTGFDSFTVALEVDGRQQVVYKHAISTMIPSQKVELG